MSTVLPNSPYARLGGADAVARLVKVFYDIVETSPEGAPLAAMHAKGHGLQHARVEQVMFLSGFLGGPPLYAEHHGHMNVKTIHAHLEITAVERDSWLVCMDKALTQTETEPTLHKQLMAHFTRISHMLQNRF